MTPQQTELNAKAARLNLELRDTEQEIARDPNGYFAEVMTPELPAMREAARLANNAANKSLEGYVFNTVTDDWEAVQN